MDNKNLLKYKGWKCNIMTINTIEYEFYPYKVMVCDNKDFNNVVYMYKKIRCFICEGVIKDLKFN